MLACSSPWRIAACRVLLRLLAPRHPPYALFILTFAREQHSLKRKCIAFSLNSNEIVLLFNIPVQFSKNFACAKAAESFKYGGDEEIRTPDPLLARQVLSQLSYTPKNQVSG